ncbi:hypothetical protein halTADL_1314 [Halohasta litchfieldiae]|jgi:hypothetical protein|uniref:SipW-cognate class signal peptide n=1 Tax=Halohasta litchfieldiae TaxID=1073996 RepID=A0A1H6XZQ2_9EURY|nr:hypothetical protein [Halohasta litchfieldiae]ATW88091.1 hypothetical protein halTADL_1314 [Halohasta litchfieldiae]SEJ34501.1 hypothetical protein SAMN05444271_15210 [Halohasta litchfieldiae]
MSLRGVAVIVALVVFVSAAGGGVYTVGLFSDSSTVDGQFSTVEAFSMIEPTGSIPNSTTGSLSNSTLVAGNETMVSPGDNETVSNETLSDTISTNETASEPNRSDKTVSDEMADTDAMNNGTAEPDAVEEPATETGTETATEEPTTPTHSRLRLL